MLDGAAADCLKADGALRILGGTVRAISTGAAGDAISADGAAIIGVVGDDRPIQSHNFELLPGVEQLVRILQPFKLASRDFHPENTIIEVRGVPVGGPKLTIIAGPCSVESRQQLIETALAVKEAGADFLRGSRSVGQPFFNQAKDFVEFLHRGIAQATVRANAKIKTNKEFITTDKHGFSQMFLKKNKFRFL